MPEFKWMDEVLPDHIQHDLQQEMSTASKILILPLRHATMVVFTYKIVMLRTLTISML